MTEEIKVPSQSEGHLAAALAAAQGEIQGAKKDSKNPFFNSHYADLASIWDACRSALAKNGLAVVQIPGTRADGFVTVKTILCHKSGEAISGELAMKPIYINKAGEEVPCNDPQGIGSCITYARRYALAAFVGVAPEDDDGNSASGRQAPPMQIPPPKSPPPKLTAAQKKADAEAVGFKATNDRIYNKIQEKKIPTEVVGGWKEQLRIREFPTDYTPGRLAELEALVDGYREPGDDAGEDVAY